jgi:hypothetical protein
VRTFNRVGHDDPSYETQVSLGFLLTWVPLALAQLE